MNKFRLGLVLLSVVAVSNVKASSIAFMMAAMGVFLNNEKVQYELNAAKEALSASNQALSAAQEALAFAQKELIAQNRELDFCRKEFDLFRDAQPTLGKTAVGRACKWIGSELFAAYDSTKNFAITHELAIYDALGIAATVAVVGGCFIAYKKGYFSKFTDNKIFKNI